MVVGGAVATIGFFLWAQRLPDLSSSNQWWAIIIAGAGMGLIIGPASTDASNRSPRETYGEVTGILQTIRYYGSSVGLAVLATILANRTMSGTTYRQEASTAAGRLDFSNGMKDVFYAMAAIMAVTFVIALVGLRKGIQEEIPDLEVTSA
ncbi:unannotated protein [freshwater metagenome]|uniref:Unannotated protein n=1 Tax=freshwater metagenome TaxID=449393 RepID=A0A6J7AM09_9ZZZZ